MKNNDRYTVLTFLAVPTFIFLILIISIPFSLFSAWVALTLYGWFLVPLGLPGINIWHMWGIMLLASRFNQKDIKIGDKEDGIGKALLKLAMPILGGLLALLVGFVLKGLI